MSRVSTSSTFVAPRKSAKEREKKQHKRRHKFMLSIGSVIFSPLLPLLCFVLRICDDASRLFVRWHFCLSFLFSQHIFLLLLARSLVACSFNSLYLRFADLLDVLGYAKLCSEVLRFIINRNYSLPSFYFDFFLLILFFLGNVLIMCVHISILDR